MPLPHRFVFAVVLVMAGMPAIAQRSLPVVLGTQIPTARRPINARRSVAAPHQEPCWQQAGISKAAIQQRRSIEQSTRAEIQSVCDNSSLTPQQRREQIRSIRERARQQIDALISPQQREALKACQQARSPAHPGGGIHAGGGGGRGKGPCGELNEPREPAPGPQQ